MTAAAVPIVVLFLLVRCGGGGQEISQPAPPASPGSTLGAHRPTELVNAATTIVRFLQGSADFGQVRLADRVSLYLSPEGGGTRRDMDREMLRQPSNWVVRSETSGIAYSLAPPKDNSELTTEVARHLNCMDYELSTRFENLARLPHVGTMLLPKNADSCLLSWNLTFVFDPKLKPPALVAAVYDQWEW